ncbi:hypothetical protein FNJ84_07770 [Paracoccus sp. M683]|uniref:hypothetical protein n=1 Tax=Paracoccus sp. M683 TaxID=2594268 RepID=UPI00117FBB1B|nr:hypothetical protein [Paracoccus sp. M683]TRW97404.1 hypothetical protein FNJ84_07770 [Paracoccus sp. M683]
MPLFPICGRMSGPSCCHQPADTGRGQTWSGFDDEVTRLDATITDLGMSSGHPTFQVRAHDGMNWTVELGQKTRADKAGLTGRSVAPGDKVLITGHQASGFGDFRFKALRLTIAGRAFELYPEACVES